MKKIKYIDLVYENCEVHRLTPKMFGICIIEKVTKDYLVNCYQYKDGEIVER
jgi:hypothetical protein